MGWYKIKIRKSDRLFSEYIRRRDGHCVYRFKCLGQPIDWKELQCSHWQKRRHEGTRFDPNNCDAVCAACHNYVENTVEGKRALDDFKLRQLGEKEHNLVILRRHTYKKRDDKLDELYCKELLKTL